MCRCPHNTRTPNATTEAENCKYNGKEIISSSSFPSFALYFSSAIADVFRPSLARLDPQIKDRKEKEKEKKIPVSTKQGEKSRKREREKACQLGGAECLVLNRKTVSGYYLSPHILVLELVMWGGE